MKVFLKKKFEILKHEAESSGSSIFIQLFIKISKSIGVFIIDLVDLLLFIVFLPVFILVILSGFVVQKSDNRKYAFFIGLEHVIDKTADRGKSLEKEGFRVLYFSFEWTGKKAANYFPEILKYSWFASLDTLSYLFNLIRYRPLYVEVYLEGKGARQILAVLLGKLYGVLQIVIDRGLHYGMVHNEGLSPLMKFLFLNTIRFADYLFSREATVEESYQVYKKYISEDRIFYDYNRVPIKKAPFFDSENKTVLFLNGFWKFRRMDLVVESIPTVLKVVPDARFIFVGGRNESEMQYVTSLIRSKGVESFAEIHSWTQSSEKYYNQAGVFVLPADRVFCNFSLLEAMERGLVPVVAKVKDAERIIIDGENGFVVEQNADLIAAKIILLLKDNVIRKELSNKARIHIINNFNSEQRMKPILNILAARKRI